MIVPTSTPDISRGRARLAADLRNLGVWMFVLRRMSGAPSGLMTVGKSRAKVYMQHSTGVTVDDVAGIDEARNELVEIVDFLKAP